MSEIEKWKVDQITSPDELRWHAENSIEGDGRIHVLPEVLFAVADRIEKLESMANRLNGTNGKPYFWPMTIWLWVDPDDKLRHSEEKVNDDCIEYAYVEVFRNEILHRNEALSTKEKEIEDLCEKNRDLHGHYANEVNENIRKAKEIEELKDSFSTRMDEIVLDRDIKIAELRKDILGYRRTVLVQQKRMERLEHDRNSMAEFYKIVYERVSQNRVTELEQEINRLREGIQKIDAAFQEEFPMLAFTAKIREIASECLRSLEEAGDDL